MLLLDRLRTVHAMDPAHRPDWLCLFVRNVARHHARRMRSDAGSVVDLAKLPERASGALEPRRLDKVLRDFRHAHTERQAEALRARVEFPTAQAAADHLSITRRSLRRRIAKGCDALSLAARARELAARSKNRPAPG